MAETVGQHSVAAFTSPVNGTSPIDANSVRGNDNTVRSAYVDHDADPGIHVQSSTLASRPVAGTAGRKWITVSSGRYQLWYDDGSRWHEVASDAVNVDCLADANLAKGDVIKITGFNNGQNLPTVNKVTASTDVAFGIVENTVTSGNIVQIVNTGLIEDVDTNGYAVGTILYPNTSGGWTTTKPTSGNYQPAGFVLRGNSSNGVLYAEFSAPRIVERSDNTASTLVLRDASGNFAAGTITAGAVTSTGLVTFASLKGTGATTVTNILDEDNMASDSATALATQQSIKAYVDAKVATVDTLAEVLANGNTTGANNIIVSSGQKITTNTIDETTAAAGVTIDSVLLKDDVVNATDIEVDTISANNGTLAVTLASTGVATIAQQPILSSLTASQAVFTDASKGLVSNAITGTGNVVMSASPTLTGTVTAATLNATTLGGTLSTAAQPNVTSVGTLSSLTVSGATSLQSQTTMSRQAGAAVNLLFGLRSSVADIATDTAGTIRFLNAAQAAVNMSIADAGDVVIRNNLAVDGATFNVDAANNRVGIGTASPGYALDVVGGSATALRISGNSAVTNNTAMRFYGLNAAADLWAIGNAVSTNDATRNFDIYDLVAGANRMRLDASGNLGLGVTPSAWSSLFKVQQIAAQSAFWGSSSATYISTNNYNDGSDKYIGTGNASRYYQFNGAHVWQTAASGTAGNAISFTTPMTLDASGNLLMGAASASSLAIFSGSAKGVVVQSAVPAIMVVDDGDTTNFRSYLGNSNGTMYVANVGNYPMLFSTNDTERARITAGGYFKASNTGTYNNATGTFSEISNNGAGSNAVWLTHTSASDPYGPYINFSAAAPDNNTNYFIACVDNAATRMIVYSDGDILNHDGTYGTLPSERRFKQDITDANTQWDDIKNIRLRRYRMISDVEAKGEDAPYQLGVIIDELEQVSPGLVIESPVMEKREVTDEDGNVTTEQVLVDTVKGWKTSIVHLKALKALQEAMARIEALEARLEALEA